MLSLRSAFLLWLWAAPFGLVYGQQVPMAVSPPLPVGQVDPTLPRKLPEFLRSAKLPEPLRLPPLSDVEARVTKRGPLTSTGVRRFVSPSLTRRATVTSAADGGTVFSVAITSPGAKRVRVHFRDFDAGNGEVWVFALGGETTMPPYTGKGIFGDGEFWSAGVDGETAIVAFVGGGGSTPVQTPFAIDAVSHQWIDPNRASTPAAASDPAAPCNLDVSCYSSYQSMAKGVVQFDYINDADGLSYLCSGSITNTRASSYKPYFLTAHHCIGSNSEARTIEAHFFYQTATCNGLPPTSVPTIIGGTYLTGASIGQGDYSFLLLNGAPAGATYLGWNFTLDIGAPAVGIHHPHGSFKRIAFGTRGQDSSVNVEGVTAPANLYYHVDWSNGLTEPGSSGSPLLNGGGQILGTLTSGPLLDPSVNVCAIPEYASYGRFGNAYAAISPYLEDVPGGLTLTPSSLTFQVTNGLVTPASQVVLVTTQSTTAISMTLQTSQPWLHASGGPTVSASSPANLLVTADATTLTTPGTYVGSITVSAALTSPVTINVSVTVTGKPSNVSVTVTPNPVYQQSPDANGYSWFYTIQCREQAGVSTQLTGLKIGGQDYSSQLISYFGTTSLSAYGTVASSVRTQLASVPTTETIEVDGVDPGSNRAWQATTQVQFLGSNANPVISVSRSSMSFSYTLSGPAPVSQPVNIANSGSGSLQWTAASDSTWLTVSPASGAAPSTLTVGVKTAGLSAGNYSGTVTVNASGAAAQRIAVSLVVAPSQQPPALSLSTSQVRFSYTVGGLSPPPQAIAITNTGGGTLTWGASTGGSSWLVTSPVSGVAPSTLSLSVNPTGLVAGTYSDLVTVLGGGTTQVIFVGLIVSVKTGPTITVGGLVNGASYAQSVAPGSLMSIFGTNLSPVTASASSVPLPTSLAGINVTLNGVPAPLYFVSPTQLNVQVPFEIVPVLANVTVTVNGQSDSQPAQIASVAPGIFTDGRRIVPYTSGSPGDVLILYITGQGAVSPSVPTGAGPAAGSSIDQLPRPVQPVSVTIGGVNAPVLFAGIPPGLVGVTQVNFQVPQVPPGDQPVVVTVGGQASHSAIFTVVSQSNQ